MRLRLSSKYNPLISNILTLLFPWMTMTLLSYPLPTTYTWKNRQLLYKKYLVFTAILETIVFRKSECHDVVVVWFNSADILIHYKPFDIITLINLIGLVWVFVTTCCISIFTFISLDYRFIYLDEVSCEAIYASMNKNTINLKLWNHYKLIVSLVHKHAKNRASITWCVSHNSLLFQFT